MVRSKRSWSPWGSCTPSSASADLYRPLIIQAYVSISITCTGVRKRELMAVALRSTKAAALPTHTIILGPERSPLIIDGYLTFSTVGWRAGHCRVFMPRRPCVLFHFHRRSVLLDPRHRYSYALTASHLETIASMFCKSCNCNSSIATRIGFAVRFCYNVLNLTRLIPHVR